MNIFEQLLNDMMIQLGLEDILPNATSFANEGKGNPFISFGNTPAMTDVTKEIIKANPTKLELSHTDDKGVTYKVVLSHKAAGTTYSRQVYNELTGKSKTKEFKTKQDRNGIALITSQPETIASLLKTAFPTK